MKSASDGMDPHPDVEPSEPPDAHAAIECVASVVARASAELGVPSPGVRWFTARLHGAHDDPTHRLLGFHNHGDDVVWLNKCYDSPQALARTVAHEIAHYWQDHARGRCLDLEEHEARELEARRRARLLVPDAAHRTPRGKKVVPWFEHLKGRYGPPK